MTVLKEVDSDILSCEDGGLNKETSREKRNGSRKIEPPC